MPARLPVLALVVLAAFLPRVVSSDPTHLQPRIPADKRAHARLPETTELQRLVVKFHEGTAVRLRGGFLVAQQERGGRDRRDLQARGLAPARVEGDAAEVQRLAAIEPRGLKRLFGLSEATLAEHRARGEARSGRQLADLDLYYELILRPGTTAGDVAALLDTLNDLQSVEIAYAEPPPHPATVETPRPLFGAITGASHTSGPTPNYQSQQGYLNAAPQGIDALYAWTQAGGTGLGIRIVDVEEAWRTTHEDLPVLFHTGGTQSSEPVWRNHGTAVLGELVGKNNSIGVKGIVYEAQAGYESISSGVDTAILNASNAATNGAVAGVVLIEQQFSGPTSSSPCTCNQSQCYFVPAEYYQSYYDAIATATANGTIVVEVAGNGSTNLDDPVYGTIFKRSFRDSGAIMVAASNSFDRGPTCWTNWGSRIDLHGWGEGVVTLGYGDLFDAGGENRWYTATFGGTSSASPIVTGAAASLQGRALATESATLEPLFVRNLLKKSGTPYTGSKNIGPLPDLRAAFALLAEYQSPTCYTLTPTHTGSGTDPVPSPTNSPSCPVGQYRAGTEIALVASPAAGWNVAGWTGTDDDASPAALNSMTMPVGDSAVSVQYVEIADVALSNRVPYDDAYTAATQGGSWRYYYIDVPARSYGLTVALTHLTKDVDLYVRQGDKPTANLHDCRPYAGQTLNEQCFFSTPASGRWWIGVNNWDTGLLGYRVTASWSVAEALDFHTLPPCRVVDTRSGPPLASGVPRSFTIRETAGCGVPASAKAVAVNITVVNPTAKGNVALWPADQPKPSTSSINFGAGQIRANNATLSLDAAGALAAQSFLGDGGTVHLMLDVSGYFE